MQEKFIESLEHATKSLQTADHLTYITFPLIKEKRLLLKILSEINQSIVDTINAILQYEYLYKRIHIYTEAKANFETFKLIAHRFNLSNEQISKVIEIMTLNERHKKSPFEFVKNDKIIIMSGSMQTDTLTLEKIKSFLIEAKDILRKANLKLRSQ